MSRRGIMLLALLGLAPWRSAGAANASLKSARDTFEYGNYADATQLAEQLLESRQLGDEHDLIDAYRIAGLGSFYLGRLDAAKRWFVGLLSVDPDYAMDPFLVPPAAVAFFDGVKRDSESELAPIRAERKAMAEQQRLAEEARRRLFEEQLRRQVEPDRPVLVERVEKRTYALNFVPFGVGEFQEDRPLAGSGIAALELGALATYVVSFAYIESTRLPDGYFKTPNGYDTALALQNVEIAALAGLGAAYVGGVVDSLLHYQGSASRIEALPQPPQHNAPTAPGSTPLSSPPPATPAAGPPKSSSLFLLPWATPTSGGLALQLTF